MRLKYCSWEKIKYAHDERLDMAIINEVIITFELNSELSLTTSVSVWKELEEPSSL